MSNINGNGIKREMLRYPPGKPHVAERPRPSVRRAQQRQWPRRGDLHEPQHPVLSQVVALVSPYLVSVLGASALTVGFVGGVAGSARSAALARGRKPSTATIRKRQLRQSRHRPMLSNPSTANRYSCHAAGFRTITRVGRKPNTHSTIGSKPPLLDDLPIWSTPGERSLSS